MVTSRRLKYCVLFCFFVALFFGFCLRESPAGTDGTLNNEPATAPQAETAPLLPPGQRSAPVFEVRIVRKYPHDPRAFTQGLIFANGFLYESTGLNAGSSLRKVDLQTGRVLQEYDLPSRYFAEGLTLWHGSLIQITWKSEKGFVYSQENFVVGTGIQLFGRGLGSDQ